MSKAQYRLGQELGPFSFFFFFYELMNIAHSIQITLSKRYLLNPLIHA